MRRVARGEADYPSALVTRLGPHAPSALTMRGKPDLLATRALALFCSVRCPGDLILKTYDLAQRLREDGTPVIGGFHSPIERECLTVLLRGTQPIVICPARSIEGLRLPAEWKGSLAAGRLLLLSPFAAAERRITAQTAMVRNRFVAALADAVLVAHAAPGSKTDRFCREVLGWGKPLYTFESDANAHLLAEGARAVHMLLTG